MALPGDGVVPADVVTMRQPGDYILEWATEVVDKYSPAAGRSYVVNLLIIGVSPHFDLALDTATCILYQPGGGDGDCTLGCSHCRIRSLLVERR
jgi:hypothetical protein